MDGEGEDREEQGGLFPDADESPGEVAESGRKGAVVYLFPEKDGKIRSIPDVYRMPMVTRLRGGYIAAIHKYGEEQARVLIPEAWVHPVDWEGLVREARRTPFRKRRDE